MERHKGMETSSSRLGTALELKNIFLLNGVEYPGLEPGRQFAGRSEWPIAGY